MAQESADQEPTMEEILASIRRIINEDDEAKPAEQSAPEPQADASSEPEAAASEPEPEPDPEPEAMDMAMDEEDVLELTDRIEDDALSGGTTPMAIADDLMIVDREDELEDEPEPAPEPVAAAPRPAPVSEPDADDDLLVDAAPASLAAGMFAALSDNLRVSSDQGQTLEGIVREMMRPMLKKWLDDNLPSIVEEKVQAEVERIARRRR
ncbi:DUF2497 domain-containing protein [Hyphomonadaceae bacterium BL14]|nr:DUF2497 domain-containing protein [Hyphomonadaceae bacterium BL14]